MRRASAKGSGKGAIRRKSKNAQWRSKQFDEYYMQLKKRFVKSKSLINQCLANTFKAGLVLRKTP